MSSMPYGSETIYCDFDCLLDTRLGTIAQKDPELAAQLLASGEYQKREIDAFPGLPREEFKALYAQRNVETLQHSIFTNMFTLLKALIKQSFEEVVKGGQPPEMELVVNYYPYDLQEDEVSMLVALIARMTNESVNVRLMNVPNELLTPGYCKDNYVLMIRYDFGPWLTMHLDSFEKVQMPAVAVYSAALYDRLPTDDEMAELKQNQTHPFHATEMSMAALFCLRLIEVSTYCISDSIKPERLAPSGSDAQAAPAVVEPEAPPKAPVAQPPEDDGFVLL